MGGSLSLGAGVDFFGVLVLRVGRGFRPLIIADFI